MSTHVLAAINARKSTEQNGLCDEARRTARRRKRARRRR